LSALDEFVQVLTALPPEQRAKVVADARNVAKGFIWKPNPGPQTDAYFSDADETLYGGEAGGGKSDLVIGLSLTQHSRSLVLRRTNKEADKLFDRYEEIIGNRDGMNAQKGWRIDGRIIDIGGCQLESDKQKRKGIPHDLKAYDELVDFTESQYLFMNAWNRSTVPGQRCRIVATTNPPTTPEGMWVIKRWAAWLDPTHPKPAKSGELRWYTTIKGKDTEVDGRGPHEVDGKPVFARSRTFIRARLDDNPDLTQTDSYAANLDALPEELREAYREGKFEAGLKDQAMQLIPTAWIRAAQDRWTEAQPKGIPQCAIGVDMSGGSHDPMILAIRHDGWFAPMVEVAAKDIPKDRPGKFCAGQVISYRRDQSIVVVDMGGGHGGGIYECLHDNSIEALGHKGLDASVRRTKDGQLGFTNRRTEVLWRFREALDPSQPGGCPIMLPPDQLLFADLAAPTYGLQAGKIQAESKKDVCARLNRSTDRGDAVVMAWSAGPTYVTDGADWAKQMTARGPLGRQPVAVKGRPNRRG